MVRGASIVEPWVAMAGAAVVVAHILLSVLV
jgi:hypothetical protein